MSEAAQRGGTPKRRWLRRIVIAIGLFLVVGFFGSFFGLNLLGAVFSSGPIVGRVVDANGQGVSGAFVSYEWKGQSYHGSTGCRAAAIVRTGSDGRYVVPWQGWRVILSTGWGISPIGPAVWAPGYQTKADGKGGVVLVPDRDAASDPRMPSSGLVDKGVCFGSAYRSRWIELRATGFNHSYSRTCTEKSSLKVTDLKNLWGGVVGVSMAQNGEYTPASTRTATLAHKYDSTFRAMAWPKAENDPDASVTPERRDEFCASVKQDFLALGERLDEK